jgi:large subunit ribosomal protein L21
MYAIVQSGGKQLKVAVGQSVAVEKIDGEAGAKVTLGQVLMIADGDKVSLGTPYLKGASVSAEVASQTRADKVIIFRKKRRQNYRRKKGHRQPLTVIKITGIKA